MEYREILTKKYILNPCYVLRSDVNRVLLTESGKSMYDNLGDSNFASFIHPVHAMLLSFFKGDQRLEEIIPELMSFFDLSEEKAWNLISPFIENKEMIAVSYDNNYFYFPRRMLIENNNYPLRTYSVEEFNIRQKLDFKSQRYNIPIETTFMLNTTCATDCIYCYADKRVIMKNQIPFERIKEIIQETKQLKFRNVDVTGGELFLYEHWKELLAELYANDYAPYLSTKVPLNSTEIDQLKDLGVKNIQISLDSAFHEDLKINLQVGESYCKNILNTVKLLNQKGFLIKVKSLITDPIFNLDKISASLDYYKQFENIHLVEITAPGYSNYKTTEQFLAYRLSLGQIKQLTGLAQEKGAETHFKIGIDAQMNTAKLYDDTFENKQQRFSKRARCTGNVQSFLILPNGDVTVCEEVYFNKNLKLGNILNTSILDMWNSEQAKNLFYIPQNKFPKESACSKCTEFNECRYGSGVCWIDIMAGYGEENWLYPSPECPYAPPLANQIFYE